MKAIVVIISLFFTFSVMAKDKKNFGQGEFQKEPVALAKVMENYEAYKNKNVVIQGKVSKVCKKKGCWLELEDKTAKVRTTMKDYGFFVPAEIKGKTVLIEGILEQKDMPKSALKHYMKDEGKTDKEIKAAMDKIPGKTKRVFQFVANGVRISS